MSQNELTGGCQCGAIRYRLTTQPDNVHVCHCRMCQKASGGPFVVLCPVPKEHFHVTRGGLSYFQSSEPTRRGFCSACGTPMLFEYHDDPTLAVLVGTLDHPELAPPVVQYGIESRVPWFAHLPELPGDKPTYSENPAMLERIRSSSRQHPDHDTHHWRAGSGT